MVEKWGVFAVTITQEKTKIMPVYLKILDKMPGLLGNTFRIGMGGDASQVDTSCSQLNEEENIQGL